MSSLPLIPPGKPTVYKVYHKKADDRKKNQEGKNKKQTKMLRPEKADHGLETVEVCWAW